MGKFFVVNLFFSFCRPYAAILIALLSFFAQMWLVPFRQLNPKIRGWTQYFRHVCAKKTFGQIDTYIFRTLWRWIKRRHPTKAAYWRRKKYFRSEGNRNWVFSVEIQTGKTAKANLDLFKASAVPIRRHIKIRAEATPYDPRFTAYFELRKQYSTRSPRK